VRSGRGGRAPALASATLGGGAPGAEPVSGGARPPPRDSAIALLTAFIDVLIFSDAVVGAQPDSSFSAKAIVIAYAAVGGAILAGRRQYPFVVLALLVAHAVVGSLVLTYRPVLLVCVALARVAMASGNRWRLLAAVGVAALAGAGWVANEVRTSPEVADAGTAALVGALYVLVLLGAVGVGLFQRAGVLHALDLERRSEGEARAAVAEERRRLARELHDIVAHSVTVMTLQSAGARTVMQADPARAREALLAVERSGTQAIGELRRLLGVLRTDDGDPSRPGGAASGPQPGLADVDALVARVRSAGLAVTVDRLGAPGALDPSVELAAFRVLQEALTNAVKHAGPGATAAVRLDWTCDALLVEVRDDGQGVGPDGGRLSTGHGLLGLAERVAVSDGEFRAAPLPDGGFEVAARLPRTHPEPGAGPDQPASIPLTSARQVTGPTMPSTATSG
jgi:signal transduction histidine kinase